MKFAVVKTGGKQYVVSENQVLKIEKIPAKEGDKITFDQVLLAGDDKGEVKIGTPMVSGAKVSGTVVSQDRAEKVIVIKYKRKVRYRRKRGHRQGFTRLRIAEVRLGNKVAKAADRPARPQAGQPADQGPDVGASFQQVLHGWIVVDGRRQLGRCAAQARQRFIGAVAMDVPKNQLAMRGVRPFVFRKRARLKPCREVVGVHGMKGSMRVTRSSPSYCVGFAAPAQANPRYASIVVDVATGEVLHGSNADATRYPASLTKIMTIYLLFEALETGRISKNTPIPISAKAAAEPPSKLGLRAGSTITVESAILALITRSANDVATAVGEFLGGSESKFASMMTAKARQLGMNSTTFRNAHGLPNNQQVTTARDMAILGLAVREHFPQHYSYFGTRQFTFNGQRIGNHNRLLGRVTGVDGIKTGFIRASGFNLVTSVRTGGRSVVAVVMGGRTGASRDDHMAERQQKLQDVPLDGAKVRREERQPSPLDRHVHLEQVDVGRMRQRGARERHAPRVVTDDDVGRGAGGAGDQGGRTAGLSAARLRRRPAPRPPPAD